MHNRNDDPNSEQHRYRGEEHRGSGRYRDEDWESGERGSRRSSQQHYPGYGLSESGQGDYGQRRRPSEFDDPYSSERGREGRYVQEGWGQGQYGAGEDRQGHQDWHRRGPMDESSYRRRGQYGGEGWNQGSYGREGWNEGQYGGPYEYGRSGEGYQQYGAGGYGRREQPYSERSTTWSGSGRYEKPGQGQEFASDYLRWRNERIRKYDEDYNRWCEERQQKFSDEFDAWRKNQSGRQGESSQEKQGTTGSSGYSTSGSSYGNDDKTKKKSS